MASSTRRRIWTTVLGGIVVAALLVLFAIYHRHDLETSNLTDEARRGVAGSFVRLSDGVVHYELAGPESARTVVLVHGFSVPYYIWDPTFQALVQSGRRVLRYDLYGRGYSDRPHATYDADLFDRQLLQLLSALHIGQPVDLMGLSMGGTIVVTFAGQHPEKVHSLTLVDPAYSSGGAPPLELRMPLLGEFYMDVFVAPELAQQQLDDFYNPDSFSDWPEKYRVQMRYKGFRRAILSTIRNFTNVDSRAAYQRIGKTRIPVLLIWGEEDSGLPVELSDQVVRAIPQAELHVIEEAAHLPHYEHPEDVNPILTDFLQKWESPQPASR